MTTLQVVQLISAIPLHSNGIGSSGFESQREQSFFKILFLCFFFLFLFLFLSFLEGGGSTIKMTKFQQLKKVENPFLGLAKSIYYQHTNTTVNFNYFVAKVTFCLEIKLKFCILSCDVTA